MKFLLQQFLGAAIPLHIPYVLTTLPGRPRRSALKTNAKTKARTSGLPSQRSNTKGYSPELRLSPVFFDFSVPFSILA